MPKKIVVIDDNRDFFDLVQTMLETAGYVVVPVMESLKALSVIQQHRPDVIMLDVIMPGRSGWEILDMIRMDPRMKSIPIIITTGAFAGVRAQRSSLSEMGVHMLPKPFDMQQLMGKLEAIAQAEQPGASGAV